MLEGLSRISHVLVTRYGIADATEDECKNPPSLLARFKSLFHIGTDNFNPWVSLLHSLVTSGPGGKALDLMRCGVQANAHKFVAFVAPCGKFHGTKVVRRGVVPGLHNGIYTFNDGAQVVLGTTTNSSFAVAASGDLLAESAFGLSADPLTMQLKPGPCHGLQASPSLIQLASPWSMRPTAIVKKPSANSAVAQRRMVTAMLAILPT